MFSSSKTPTSRIYSTFEDVCILSACVDLNISRKLGLFCGINRHYQAIFHRYCEIGAEKGASFTKRNPESIRARLYNLIANMYILFGTCRERELFLDKSYFPMSMEGPRECVQMRQALLKLLYEPPIPVKAELTLEPDINVPRVKGKTRSKRKQRASMRSKQTRKARLTYRRPYLRRTKRKARHQPTSLQQSFDLHVEVPSQTRNPSGNRRRVATDVGNVSVAGLSVRGGVRKNNSSGVEERQLPYLMLLKESWKASRSIVQLKQDNLERLQNQFKQVQDGLSAHEETLEMQQKWLLRMIEGVSKGDVV